MHVKVHLNTRKHWLFTVGVVKHWSRLPRQLVESLEFLEMLDAVLGDWFYLSLPKKRMN